MAIQRLLPAIPAGIDGSNTRQVVLGQAGLVEVCTAGLGIFPWKRIEEGGA